MKEINCNLCGQNDTKLLFKSKDRRVNIKGKTIFSVVQCKNCGLVYVNPQPTYQELKPFYGENYFRFSHQCKRRRKIYYFLKRVKNNFFDKIFYSQNPKFYKWKVLNNSKNGKFLDIGCATGLQDIKFMQDFPNWEFYGVEPDAVAFQEASKIKGFNIKKGFLEDANYSDNFFDIILMNQVLEHVPDPKKTLLECSRILKNDGKLIVAVPNYGSLSLKIFGKYWYHLDIPRHLFHFTPQTIGALLKEVNLKIDILENEALGGTISTSLFYLLKISPDRFSNKLILALLSYLEYPFARLFETLNMASGLYILASKR